MEYEARTDPTGTGQNAPTLGGGRSAASRDSQQRSRRSRGSPPPGKFISLQPESPPKQRLWRSFWLQCSVIADRRNPRGSYRENAVCRRRGEPASEQAPMRTFLHKRRNAQNFAAPPFQMEPAALGFHLAQIPIFAVGAHLCVRPLGGRFKFVIANQ